MKLLISHNGPDDIVVCLTIYDCRFDVKTDVLVSWKWIFMQKATHFCIFIQWIAFCFVYLISVNIITNYKQMPLFAYTFQSWYFSFEKAWVSPPETHAFTSWNPWFHSLKPMLSDRNLMGFKVSFQNEYLYINFSSFWHINHIKFCIVFM